MLDRDRLPVVNGAFKPSFYSFLSHYIGFIQRIPS